MISQTSLSELSFQSLKQSDAAKPPVLFFFIFKVGLKTFIFLGKNLELIVWSFRVGEGQVTVLFIQKTTLLSHV